MTKLQAAALKRVRDAARLKSRDTVRVYRADLETVLALLAASERTLELIGTRERCPVEEPA